MQNIKIKFMTTVGCHLCDEAYAMLQYLVVNEPEIGHSISIEMVEIANDDKLIEEFGIRIPVLLTSLNDKTQLGWPFELKGLRDWLING